MGLLSKLLPDRFKRAERQREQLKARLDPVNPASDFSKISALKRNKKISIGTLTINGLKLRYSHRHPSKQSKVDVPLLMLNGLGCGLDFNRDLLTAFGDREILVLEMPGEPDSRLNLLPRRMRFYAKLVAAAAEELKVDGLVDVLGIGWGGALAQEFAHYAPQRVRRLVLAATSSGTTSLPGKLSLLAKLATPKRFQSESALLNMAPALYGGVVRRKPALLRKVAASISPVNVQSYLKQIYAVTGWSSLPWAHQLQMPTLIMSGDDDPLVPLINARLLHWFIPKSQLHVVRGGGHLFPLLRSNETASVISDFLALARSSLEWGAVDEFANETQAMAA